MDHFPSGEWIIFRAARPKHAPGNQTKQARNSSGGVVGRAAIAGATIKTEQAGERYDVTRITCAGACTIAPTASENLLFIVPVKPAGTVVIGAEKPTGAAGVPLRVERKGTFTITAPAAGTEALLVRIR